MLDIEANHTAVLNCSSSRPEAYEVAFDPALCVDEEMSGIIEKTIEAIDGRGLVFDAPGYPAALSAQFVKSRSEGDVLFVRAANASEVLTRRAERGETMSAMFVDRTIRWRETASSARRTGRAAAVWSGEVLLRFPNPAIAGPFFAVQAAADAWAFHLALTLQDPDVVEAQIVCWHCAEQFAAGLLVDGDAEFKRLNRFWEVPVRSTKIIPVWLPAR